MKVHRNFINLNITNPVVTTGSFDGVHVGHKAIIERLKRRAREVNGEAVLITFYPHPRKVLYPDTAGKDLQMINTQKEKIIQLEKLGLDHLIIVEFTLDFSKTTSVDFIRKYLVSQLHVRHVIIGFNHHFGHNREGDLEYLQELGKFYEFTVEEIPEQDIHNESVSSTKIRKSLTEGYIQRANAYLDHPYVISGKLNCAKPLGRFQPYLVNIEEEEKLFPPEGGYAISIQNQAKRIKGVLWVELEGNQDITFCLEECDPGLQNQFVRIELHKRISNHPPKDETQLQRDLDTISELIY